jgi:hypothetical protein
VKLTVHKLVDTFGWYPRIQQVSRLVVLLGAVLHMPSCVFYDPKSYDGYIPHFLQNLGCKLPCTYVISVSLALKRISITQAYSCIHYSVLWTKSLSIFNICFSRALMKFKINSGFFKSRNCDLMRSMQQ